MEPSVFWFKGMYFYCGVCVWGVLSVLIGLCLCCESFVPPVSY